MVLTYHVGTEKNRFFAIFIVFCEEKNKLDALTSVSQRHRRWTSLGFSFSEQVPEYF
jgi:hypothetical protein